MLMIKLGITILFSIMTLNLFSQSSKETEFAKTLLAAFIHKDLKTYKSLSPDDKDLEELISDIKKNSYPGVNNDEWIQQMREMQKQADSLQTNEFDTLVKRGERLGINWPTTSFKKFVFQIDNPGNSSKSILRGHLNFESNGKSFMIFGIEAAEFSSGYKINNIRAIIKGELKKFSSADVYRYDSN
jgi:hypothetical protein